MRKPADWNDTKHLSSKSAIERKPIKIDHTTISTKYIDMQETNDRLQKLISRFSSDNDRILKSVYESVQQQNSIIREVRKTTSNAYTKSKVAKTHAYMNPSKTPYDKIHRFYYLQKDGKRPEEILNVEKVEPKARMTPVFPEDEQAEKLFGQNERGYFDGEDDPNHPFNFKQRPKFSNEVQGKLPTGLYGVKSKFAYRLLKF